MTMQMVMPQSDQEWHECVAKGRRLLDDLEMDWPAKGVRDFPGAYTRWYWQYERSNPSMGSAYGYGLEDALRGLGISVREDDWVQIDMKHEKAFPAPPVDMQAYAVDGEAYRATGAECIVAINKSDGVILMLSAQSPKHCARTIRRPKVPNDELPELHRASDLVWGQWWQLSSSVNMQHLKYVITHAVVNTKSTPIMLQALRRWSRNALAEFEEWDKRATISVDSEEGAALMGIPTSKGIAHFLRDHQPEVGKHRITHIDIFTHTSPHNRNAPVLLYHIEKVPRKLRRGKGLDTVWWGSPTSSTTTTHLDTSTSVFASMTSGNEMKGEGLGYEAAAAYSRMSSVSGTTTTASSARSSIAMAAGEQSSRNTSFSMAAGTPHKDEEWVDTDPWVDVDTDMDIPQ
ncbi:hypothetical protein K491DRAFT_744357 [Lophiostoma macrostomum CBS 122681]|uniref:Uncharacterized protein n=1 Tax=Lophiostoma macrostomum CBS 122681 TaxID=1314788 RepID=A0A6A6T9K5_9PLEO|nr:hypothetical protein K491DRAFT_744357 [Lophiostoma macrostomum CBS 122681]